MPVVIQKWVQQHGRSLAPDVQVPDCTRCVCWHKVKHILKFLYKFSQTLNRANLFEPRHEKTCLCHMRTTKAQSEQHLCCSLPRSYNSSSFYIRDFKPLASFFDCAGRFASYLVENPEGRFSRDVAYFISSEQRSILALSFYALTHELANCTSV